MKETGRLGSLLELTLNAIPNDCQRGSCTNKVIASPHAKNAACHDGISNVVDTSAPRVEEHGDGRDHLTSEDDENALPPVQSDPNHCTAQSPVSKRQTHVEGDIIPPSPCSLHFVVRHATSVEEGLRYLFWWRGVQILVTPYLSFIRVSMLIKSGWAGLNEVFKSFTTPKCVLECRGFVGNHGPKFGDAHHGKLLRDLRRNCGVEKRVDPGSWRTGLKSLSIEDEPGLKLKPLFFCSMRILEGREEQERTPKARDIVVRAARKII
jgi:hypothetical protein